MTRDILTGCVVLFAIMAWGGNRPWSMALFSMLAILTLAVAVIWDVLRGRFQLRISWTFAPILAFLALVFVQYLRSHSDMDSPPGHPPYTIEPYATALYLLVAFGCFALFFCTVNGFRSQQQVSRLAIVIIALGVFEACYGLVQWLGGFQYIWGSPINDKMAHGTMPNHNHYALLLNMAISVGVGFLYKRTIELLRGQKLTTRSLLALPDTPKLLWILGWLAIMGLGVFASASRMGVFAMFVCLGFMVAAVWLAERKKFSTALVLSVAIAIIGLGIYCGLDVVFDRYMQLTQPGQFKDGRVSLWQDAWPMIWKTPWFGQGLGSFQWTFRAYETMTPDIPAIYAHNDYLQVFAETGIAGLCLAIWAFVVCWRTAKRNLLDQDPLVRGIGLATIGVLSAAAIQEITDYSLYTPGTLALFVLLIGLNERTQWLRTRVL